ncbi:hypothetical protein MY8738_008704 [Beauveria namnaoensis]
MLKISAEKQKAASILDKNLRISWPPIADMQQIGHGFSNLKSMTRISA